ncbi:hypothetical protein GCM10007148_22550 [Parvularcula lutaonensis]|nr:hypothetical protein GCM10007148_22550 [Parvularcula lutaonensis]
MKLTARALLPLLLLAACGQQGADVAQPASDDSASPLPPPPVARASITLGSFEGPVTDLAALEAKPFGFQSAILAANGDAGIAAIRADGEASTVIETIEAPYLIATASFPTGDAILSLSQSGDLDLLDPEGSGSIASGRVATGAMSDLCVFSGDETATAVVVTASSTVAFVDVSLTGEPISVVGTPEVIDGVIGCAAVGDELYLRTAEGWDRQTASGAKPTPLENAPVLVAAGGEVFAVEPVGEDARLLVNGQPFDTQTADGEPLRPLMVEPAYGNFGGVLRDGALIVLDEGLGLHLIPWPAIAKPMGWPGQLESLLPDDTVMPVDGPPLPSLELDDGPLDLKEPGAAPREPYGEDELPQPPDLPENR